MAKSNNTNTTAKFNVTYGILGHDNVPANAAVLLNERKMRIEGDLVSATEFLAIDGVKSTKAEDIVMPVLAVMLADLREREGFANEFKVVVVDGAETDSRIRAKSYFTKYLKGNVIYKSNSEGNLNKAVVLDEGLRLSGTCIKPTNKQPIFTANGNDLRVIMHQTALAFIKQASMFTGIVSKARAIFETAYVEEQKVAPKPTQADNKAQTVAVA
jgi:hypothetical protein